MRAFFAIARLAVTEIFRKKDFYAALILTAVILFYASSLEFYNARNISRYLMEIGLLLIFLFSVILTVALAARQYPSEIQNRTCHVLLAKPVSRMQFVTGKFAGAFLAGSSCFIIFYAVFLAVVWAKAGALSWVLAFQAFYLFALNLAVVAAMASAFSYYLTLSASVSMTLVLYLLINTYGPGLKEASERLFWLSRWLGKAVYYLLPHFEFFDLRQRFIHDGGPIPLKLVAFLTGYAAVYTFIFLFLAWLKFRKESL